MQTNLEVLETLFLSVYSHCGASIKGYISNRIPTILMIATHAKGLTDQQRQDVVVEFYKAFEGRPFMDHLPSNRSDAFHFIDNEAREPEAFTIVKQIILKAAAAIIQKQCPISFLQFESDLLQISQSKSVITRQEVSGFARRAGVDSEDGVTGLLLHYSYKGFLLFYPDVPSLQDIVFLDPQEVSDLVSSVISTHDGQPSSSDLQLACVRYDTFGMLEEALLDDILVRCGRLEQKEVILGLLQKFDLAAEVAVNTKFIDEDDSYTTPKSGRVFLVPSMLVYNERKVYQKKADDVVVLYHYPDKFIFETVFNHVIVKTVQWCNKEGHYVRRIYRGTGYFDFKMRRQSFRLQQCPDTFSIKCYLTIHAEDQPTMLGHRQHLLDHLKESLDEVHQAYIPSAKYPIGYVECPLEHEKGCLPHIRLDEINEVNDIPCPKNEGQIVPRKAYMLLLTTSKGKETAKTDESNDRKVMKLQSSENGSNCMCETGHCATIDSESNTNLTNEVLTRVPSIKQLLNIVVLRVAADWDKVAHQLEFDMSTIRLVQRRCGNDPEECCHQLLLQWVTTDQGVGPKNWATLLAALKKIRQLRSVTQQIEDDLTQLTMQPDTPLSVMSQWQCAVL